MNTPTVPSPKTERNGSAASTPAGALLSTTSWFVIGLASAVAFAFILAASRPLAPELAAAALVFRGEVGGTPWLRHAIDPLAKAGDQGGEPNRKGADGTKFSDIDGDGDLDAVTPWEQGGIVRVYLNPGPGDAAALSALWPAVTVSENVRHGDPKFFSPEDADFADMDGDGALDVVSATEGGITIFIHWAPPEASADPALYLDPALWRTEAIRDSNSKNWNPKTMPRGFRTSFWLQAVPADVDGRDGLDIFAGGQGATGVGWFESPAPPYGPRDLEEWRWHPLYNPGWIMSLKAIDMDEDGDADALFSSRNEGPMWLENPGPAADQTDPKNWAVHQVGTFPDSIGLSMFLSTGDVDGDGVLDIVQANKSHLIIYHRGTQTSCRGSGAECWESYVVNTPGSSVAGTPKAATFGDIDLDGRQDFAYSTQYAGNKTGVVRMSRRAGEELLDGYRFDSKIGYFVGAVWDAYDIGGRNDPGSPSGSKFDLIDGVDLDGDGDQDIITTEEHALGVVWYENPECPGENPRCIVR